MMKQTKLIALMMSLALALMLLIPSQPSPGAYTGSVRIRRTILLKFKAEASPAEIQKILKEVKANITGIKGVRNVCVGAQIIDRIPFTYGISMDFEDEAALKAYRQDQEHRRTHNDYSHLIEQAQISDIRDE